MNKEQRQRLAEIAARMNAATAGPWPIHRQCDEYNRLINLWGISEIGMLSIFERADADFIVHARDDVPWLVELVQEMEHRLHPVCNEDVDEYYRIEDDA